jgi:oligopeptide/dipeptide ABC transporter ATP-binding protein
MLQKQQKAASSILAHGQPAVGFEARPWPDLPLHQPQSRGGRAYRDRVAVMYLGRIVESAERDALFRAPRHPYTRALLASVLTPDPGLGVPDTGLGLAFPNPLAPPPGCVFHPRCPQAGARCRSEPPRTIRDQQAWSPAMCTTAERRWRRESLARIVCTNESSSSAKADDPIIASVPSDSQTVVITGCPAFAGHDRQGPRLDRAGTGLLWRRSKIILNGRDQQR